MFCSYFHRNSGDNHRYCGKFGYSNSKAISHCAWLKGQIDEIATQPVDKSLAVSEANKKPADPMAIAKSEADATRSPQQAFGAYFKQAIAAS